MSDLELKSCIVNLRRLLHCMTNDPFCRHSNNHHNRTSTETTASPSLLVMRAEMARSILHDITQQHEQLLLMRVDDCNNHDYTRIIQDLQQQVEYACQTVDEIVATQQSQKQKQQNEHLDENAIDNPMNHDNTDWVHVIFEQPEQTMTAATTTLPRRQQQQQAEEGVTYLDNDNDDDEIGSDDDDDEEESTMDNIHQESSSLHHNTAKNYSVEELQKQQRQQLEEEISLMAQQLKKSTQSMHTTLQHQTQDLQDMEDLAVDNVDRVTGITKDTQEHLRKSWKSSIGKYTMVFVILGTFVVTFMTIRIVPRRSNACVPFVTCPSSKQPKQEQCVILEDGTSLCRTTKTTTSSSSSPHRGNKKRTKNTKPIQSAGNTKEEEQATKKKEEEEDYHKECSADNGDCHSHLTTGTTSTEFQEKSDSAHDDNVGQKKEEAAASVASRKQAEAVRHKKKEYQEKDEKTARLAATRRQQQQQQQQQQLEEETKRLGEEEEAIKKARLVAMNEAAAQQERENAEKEAARRQEEETEKRKKQEEIAQAARRQQAEAEERKRTEEAFRKLEAEAEAEVEAEAEAEAEAKLKEVQEGKDKARIVAAEETAGQQKSSTNANENKGDDDSEKGEKKPYQYDKEPFTQTNCPLNSDGECITNFDADTVAKAASQNDVEALRYYLSLMPQYANSVDENGWQPIHEGARFGHTEILRVLLTIGHVDANAQISGNGVTPLELAYAEGFDDNHDAVKLLKAHGGSIVNNYAAGEDNMHNDNNNDDDQNYTDEDFRHAANHGNIILLEDIIATNPSIDINNVDENGWGAIHEAVRNKDKGLETVQFLVDIVGCDVNLKTRNGPSALEITTGMHGDNNEIVQYLRQVIERSSQQGSHRNEL